MKKVPSLHKEEIDIFLVEDMIGIHNTLLLPSAHKYKYFYIFMKINNIEVYR
jgi:hypothetical protein